MAQCSTAESFPQDHRGMGGEKTASKAWSACRDNGNSCTEPSCYMGTAHVYLRLSLWHCLILNRMCKRLWGRMSMESRRFAFQDLIHSNELKHFTSWACQHRRGKKNLLVFYCFCFHASLFMLWAATDIHAVMNAVHYWGMKWEMKLNECFGKQCVTWVYATVC